MNKLKRMGVSRTSIISTSSSGITYMRPRVKQRTGQEIEKFKNEYTTETHMETVAKLEIKYSTSTKNGLNQNQADELLKQNGPNCLVPPKIKPRWLIFIEYMFGGFASLLWFSAILTFVGFAIEYYQSHNNPNHDSFYLGSVLVIVNIFTGLFAFHQQSENIALMDNFNKMSPKYAQVIRDGHQTQIPSEEVVIGDLVLIKAGDHIPADLRIIHSEQLKVDNSAITGESLPQTRSNKCTDIHPLETENLVFSGTNVIEGNGVGIAINCGDNTLIGNIAGLTTSLMKGETLLQKELKDFIRLITIVALAIGLTFFTICMCIGYDFFHSFTYLIAIMVANVPEGLPVTLTACMTLTAKRMATKNCLIKKLESIETLGACNVICSDKTGTLTQNRMTVSHLFYDNQFFYVLLNHESIVDGDSNAYQALCRLGYLCNSAIFVEGSKNVPINQRPTIGDASESAILKIMEQLVGGVENKRKQYPKLCEIPFNSSNKYQVSVHRFPDDQFVVLMKGAPEKILERCNKIINQNQTVELTQESKRIIQKAIMTLGSRGERVIALADLYLSKTVYDSNYKFDSNRVNFPLNQLRFVGLISMIDPPRPSVPEAVSKCQNAGIRVIMVTGDHPITATAIARQVGILSPNSITNYDIGSNHDFDHNRILHHYQLSKCTAAVITGHDLIEMNQMELEGIILRYNEIVFARTSPQQKLKIVEAFQRLNMIVAVTGDGVNDSPALKRADIGIAMGITGTDVSKGAADIILLDDNFSSIVTAIEEGRLIFDNLKKSIAYLLTSNIPEIIPFVLMVTLNIPSALSVIAIIVIDVGTDLWPAISLAYEKPEADIMKRKPRDPINDKLINSRLISLTYLQIGMIQTYASLVSYFFIMAQHGFFWYDLIGKRNDWESIKCNDLLDSYGFKWNYNQRQILNRKLYTGYFLSLIITQITDLLVCKTRRLSLFQQGMNNWILNAGIFFQIMLAIIVVYCPYLNYALKFEPIHLISVIFAVPFALLIFGCDELRKYYIRKYPEGIIYMETYY